MKFNTAISILILFFFSNPLLAQTDFQKLPAKFEAHQIFIETITEDQDTIKFFTDTGGGAIFITEQLSNKLELEVDEQDFRGRSTKLATLPKLQSRYQIPFIPQEYDSDKETILNEKRELLSRKIIVMPPAKGINKKLEEKGIINEGMLGQDWFATRIWTFDYEKEELLLHNSFALGSRSDQNVVDIFFQKDEDRRHTHHMPRIKAEIASEEIDFLLDTGATTFVSENALIEMNDKLPSIRGASYVTQSKFEEWQSKYPEWKVIEKGELFTNASYIEVPEVTIAGHKVGPVWFTMRPDQAFYQHMAAMMDKKVDGALGGSLFQYFRITVNYPDEYAIFEIAK